MADDSRWFCQRDLVDYFSAPTSSAEWVVVEEHFQSGQRKLDRWLLPVPARKCGSQLRDSSYSDLFQYARRRIHTRRDVRYRFLSSSFCKVTGLTNRDGTYKDERGRVAARREKRQASTYFHSELKVRQDLVQAFLDRTSQVAIAAIDSLLYSERDLADFGLKQRLDDEVHGGHFVYAIRLVPSAYQQDPRALLRSTSHVFGKKVEYEGRPDKPLDPSRL